MASEFLFTCKEDVVRIKDSFRYRKYRRCAVLCSQALQEATHPLHRTFLYFYQAICYENLGHISHNYSSNKIPLLEQAKDSFTSANDLLPLPFLTTGHGQYGEPKTSPLCATLDLLDFYSDSPSVYPEHTPVREIVTRGRSLVRSTPDQTFDEVSITYTIPDFDVYSPRVPLAALPDPESNKLPTVSKCQGKSSNHKARLSRSLSSQHVLAEDLIPSPLYSRAPSSRKEVQRFISLAVSPLPFVALGKPLPPTPINRPLPTLPFNPCPKFVLKGKRIVIAPSRKTALSTLIHKFEGRSPFDNSPRQESPQSLIYVDPTPNTARFKRISAMFEAKEDEDDKENFTHDDSQSHSYTPATPCPRSQGIKPEPLYTGPQAPSHLESYNNHLLTFRSSLLNHIKTVTNSITETRDIQLEHEAEKRRNFAAMHSHARNSSSIPAPSPTKSGPRSKSRGRSAHRAPRLPPAKDMRLRSFWSLQVAEAQERAEKSCEEKADGVSWEVERKARERKERIERLKRNEWRNVTKEAKGWKGSAYYEELRRSVEEELLAAGC